MKYNFDEEINRCGTNCFKYDGVEKKFGYRAFPMWIADMDFATPGFIIDDLHERLEHPVFGYGFEDVYPSMKKWLKKRFDYELSKNSFFIDKSVMSAVSLALNAVSQEGEGVIIQTPVYFPFYDVVKSNNRELLENKLVLQNGKYEIDFEDLQTKAKDAKVLLLCSPHNPVGRIWSSQELEKISQIADENALVIISDEVHCDLILPNNTFYKISKFYDQSISITSVTKTFNLASLPSAITVIENRDLRKKYKMIRKRFYVSNYDVLNIKPVKSAYEYGEEWLEQLLKYLDENVKFVEEFLKDNIPQIKLIKPEATYLLWLDMRELDLDPQNLQEIFLKDARVAMYEGSTFGDEGKGFFRMNIATTRHNLQNAMYRIVSSLKNLDLV